MTPTMNTEAWIVVKRSDKKMSGVVVSRFLELTRQQAVDLVEHERRKGRPEKVAIETVADQLGRSPSWLRKIVRNDPNVRFDPVSVFNTLQAAGHDMAAWYSDLCDKIEADTKARRERLAALNGEMDAAFQGSLGERARKATRVTPHISQKG
jgi:hypothetical protein